MRSPFDLTGRVAVVTGGNRGLGLGMALGLARAGASIMIAARDRERAGDALHRLGETGAAADFVETDVADRAACVAMAEAAMARFGRIDILVANAGIVIPARAADLDEATWRRTLDVNLSGVLFPAQAAHPHMQAAGGGKIVTVGSMMALFGGVGVAAYGASKGGVVQLTRALAVEWAADNIQANCILPGWLATDMGDRVRRDPDRAEAIVRRTPARRWGEPGDMAGTAVFLASSASDFVTGAAIPVDGGYSIRA